MTDVKPATRVVNIRTEPADVYIGRGSPWGNPYTHVWSPGHDLHVRIVGSREEAIEKYEEYLRANPYLMAQLPYLRGRTLGCYCKPQACHGDVLIKLLEELDVT